MKHMTHDTLTDAVLESLRIMNPQNVPARVDLKDDLGAVIGHVEAVRADDGTWSGAAVVTDQARYDAALERKP